MVSWPLRLAGLVLAAAPPTVAATTLRFDEGIARNPDSAIELYREQHWLRSEGDRPLERIVLYRCPDGTAFGRKWIDYRVSTTAPSFVFEDRRSGYREGFRRDGGAELFFRAKAGAPEKFAFVRSAPLVVDAGFDQFIREHWAPLVAGKSLPLEFAVPARLRSMRFSVRRAAGARVASEEAWIFRLKLEGLLGLLVPAIDVSYGRQSQRLLRFEGLSNLRDDAGHQPLVARIDFGAQPREASEVQWQAALQTPLSACRTGR